MVRNAFGLDLPCASPPHQTSIYSDENHHESNHLHKTFLLPHKTAKRSKHIYSDRFIPSRVSTKLDTDFELHTEPSIVSPAYVDNQGEHSSTNVRTTTNTNGTTSTNTTNTQQSKDVFSGSSYSMLLQSELLGMESSTHALPSNYYEYMDTYYDPYSPPTTRGMMRGSTAFNFTSTKGGSIASSLGQQPSNIFKFKTPQPSSIYDPLTTSRTLPSSVIMRGATSMMRTRGYTSGGGHGTRRKIAKTPFKILDAPALQDDFYLNLVDWSSTNVLAVGLGSSVYLWSACTSKVTKLCDLGTADSVTSVSWSQRGSLLSIGTNTGETQLWDTSAGKKVRTMSGHMARVGTSAWNSQLLATGSRDRTILLRDIRAADQFQHQLSGHKQEVCGLKWSFDDTQLASGGNDNKLFVWSVPSASTSSTTIPVVRFSDHTAAVKAIAWSPHQNGLLASGGGTADRCIRFWNTHTQTALNAIDTGSQVCNLMWSRNVNEVVSTHGYSLNQIIVWKYPTMTKLATLTGHTFRVLYLAMSPDGQTIVTGAGDETLRFWNAFPSSNTKGSSGGGRLGPGVLLPMRMGNEIR